MKLFFKFLDTEKWSMFGTLNTIIPFSLTLLLSQKVDLQHMIFASLIGMMGGELIPKILFVGFLNFLVMKENIDWVIRSFIYVFSVLIIHYIPYDNFIHKFVYTNPFVSFIFKFLIVIWMVKIGYDIYHHFRPIVGFIKKKTPS